MNLTTIRRALAAQVEAVAGITCYPYWPDRPDPPCAGVLLATDGTPVLYRSTYGNALVEVRLRVRVEVPGVSDVEGQETLAGYLSTGSTLSIPDAVDSDHTLGLGDDTRAWCESLTLAGVRVGDNGEDRYYVGELVVPVVARRT